MTAVDLEALGREGAFALLGPGFGDGAGWTLVTELSEGDGGEVGVWLAAYETPGRGARRFTGRARSVPMDAVATGSVGGAPSTVGASPGGSAPQASSGGAAPSRPSAPPGGAAPRELGALPRGAAPSGPSAPRELGALPGGAAPSVPLAGAAPRGLSVSPSGSAPSGPSVSLGGAVPPRVRLDDAGFLEGVASIRERIAAGDVYQVNLTVRARVEAVSGAALLSRLCARGVPRFAAWVRLPDGTELVSASPELLFEVHGRAIRAEPMKGTAPAGQRAWLDASEKDRAELAMITDLLRDDLNRLCVPRSVEVPCARRFIELPYAVQAVSDVTGTLREGVSLRDVVGQLHPGGSVTGAPREAACAVISQLEREPRGAYCGALGLERGDGATFALLIRTAERRGDGAWRYGVGSGITWDSDPQAELAEVRLKLGALG